MIVLEINETHPARVRCQVTCLNQQGTSTYNPVMALIATNQEEFIQVHGRFYYSWNGLHFEVRTANVSYCEAQNNYTMEYEYLITSNSSKIDRSVVICGVAYYQPPPYLCWGQSYGIIRYNNAFANYLLTSTTPTPDSITRQSTPLNVTASLKGANGHGHGWLVYTLISIMMIIIILFTITLSLTIGFLHLRYQSRTRIAPQCVQTVEQTLVIKVEQPVASESAAVREKETSFSENSDSSRSSIQAQLQEKLPDTISSRSTTL